MKYTLLALGAACVFTGCAGVKVAHTDVATGATKPEAIYIRSYIAGDAIYRGNHGHRGERAIRRSLAPAEFSKALKEEMEKMAPAMVLADNEVAPTGWLVESDIEVVHAGSPTWRAVPLVGTPGGVGKSKINIHVRVIDVNGRHSSSGKDSSKSLAYGNVIYEFDLDGGSRGSGALGSIYAPGLGYSVPFDYKNAAERVLYALSVDPHGYGTRNSFTIR